MKSEIYFNLKQSIESIENENDFLKILSNIEHNDVCSIYKLTEQRKKYNYKLWASLYNDNKKSIIGYGKFLNTDYWKTCVLIVKSRDNDKCIICGTRNNLTVHHLTYWNHFNELNHLEDLITVCWDCHKSLHASDKVINHNYTISLPVKYQKEYAEINKL